MHLLSSITESFVMKRRESTKKIPKTGSNSSKYWEEGKFTIYNVGCLCDDFKFVRKREALVISSVSYQKSKGKNKQINYRYVNILNDLNADSAKIS